MFWDLVNAAWVHERLAALYAVKGDRSRESSHLERFIEYWKDADPELQPRVAAARTKLAQLKAS